MNQMGIVVSETTVTSDDWVEVAIPSEQNSFSFTARLRSASEWLVSHLDDGAIYATVAGAFAAQLDDDRNRGRLFFAKLPGEPGQTDTLELIVV